MAALSSGSPPAGVYLCIFGSAAARTAASTMYPGVGKSGSPAPNPMTGLPAAFSALAFASTARVADSDMADTRGDIFVVWMLPWCHFRRGDAQLVSPWASLVEPLHIVAVRRSDTTRFCHRARAARRRGCGGRP